MATKKVGESDQTSANDARSADASGGRRAVLLALAGSPVILTLMSGRARAEYDNDGIYHPGESCFAPGEGQEPPPPPPGCAHGHS